MRLSMNEDLKKRNKDQAFVIKQLKQSYNDLLKEKLEWEKLYYSNKRYMPRHTTGESR